MVCLWFMLHSQPVAACPLVPCLPLLWAHLYHILSQRLMYTPGKTVLSALCWYLGMYAPLHAFYLSVCEFAHWRAYSCKYAWIHVIYMHMDTHTYHRDTRDSMHIHAYMHMHITLWEGTCNLFFGASLMIICMIDKISDNFMCVKCMINHSLGFWRIWLWLIWINTPIINIYIYIYDIYLLLCYLLDAIKSRYT